MRVYASGEPVQVHMLDEYSSSKDQRSDGASDSEYGSCSPSILEAMVIDGRNQDGADG